MDFKTYAWATEHTAGWAYTEEDAAAQKAAAEAEVERWKAAGKCLYCGGKAGHAPHLYCGG